MSGAEVLGIVAGTSQIVSQCLGALEHVQKALDQYRNGSDHLYLVAQDVEVVANLIRLISREPSLNQQELLHGVGLVKDRATSLKEFIEYLEPKFKKDGAFQRMSLAMYLITNAPQDMDQLDEKRKHLLQANVGLLGLLSVAKIGLHRDDSRGQTVVNVIIVQRVDTSLRESQGLTNGILMARFLQKCGLSERDGEVLLSEKDLNTLENMLADAHAASSQAIEDNRSVIDNKAAKNAFMVNAKLGNGTKNSNAIVLSRNVSIMRNEAGEGSMMINDNTSLNGFETLQKQWLMQIAISQGARVPVTEDLFKITRTSTRE